MKRIIQILYSLALNPAVFLLVHLIAPFNRTLRRAVAGRYGILKKARHWQAGRPGQARPVLIHAASMGEFEHIKPIVNELQSRQIPVVLTFFSPSGYEHVKNYPGIKLILYAPFDFAFWWKALFKIVQPRFLVISKHDVWPNQVWAGNKRQIPTFLVNASLRSNSSRIKAPGRYLLKYVYGALSRIYTISETDKKRFERYFPQANAQVAGDTKFDQVLLRKKNSAQKAILTQGWGGRGVVLLFGSIWPEDARVILPALTKILSAHSQVKAILVPHQPTQEFVLKLQDDLSKFAPQRYSHKPPTAGQRVLIIDVVGILADLYKYAQIAYVGGSFKQGIHNVMEPAIYGIPVLYGPVHKNSLEAIYLLKEDGARLITDSANLENELAVLIKKVTLRKEIGDRALHFAQKNVGATQRIMESWQEALERG